MVNFFPGGVAKDIMTIVRDCGGKKVVGDINFEEIAKKKIGNNPVSTLVNNTPSFLKKLIEARKSIPSEYNHLIPVDSSDLKSLKLTAFLAQKSPTEREGLLKKLDGLYEEKYTNFKNRIFDEKGYLKDTQDTYNILNDMSKTFPKDPLLSNIKDKISLDKYKDSIKLILDKNPQVVEGTCNGYWKDNYYRTSILPNFIDKLTR